jgi:hypothetical protein
MSTLFEYVKSLLPKFGRDKVTELARQNQNELVNFVIPSLIEAEKGLARREFKSNKIAEFTNVLNKNIKPIGKDTIVTTIRKALEQVVKNNRVIETHITESFEDEVVIAGVTVLKVNLLRLIETTAFVSRYTSKFLNYIYILETAAVGGDLKYVQDSLSKGEIDWLEKRYLDYVFSLRILSKSEKEIISIISEIPEVEVDENPNMLSSVFGMTKVDPFGFRNLSGFTNSPIFHVRLLVAQHLANKYKEQKELKQLLQLRLLDLQANHDKSPNAKLQQQIVYTQARVDRISDEIRKAEEDVA